MCALETRKLESTRMPMFVTFYSYKGGVGRTLALANVATLLAKDRGEPCRVLVWDFDLAAPGLQDVVKCKWAERKVGFVDYLDFYLRNAELDDITHYIHPTAIPRVDILPAGFMGRQYAQRLEDIQWQEIYEQARGFQFIANTKIQISKIQPTYDYVLIDSLTGYSDVGGICVNQLADAVVLVFRLNQQNIQGIAKVYQSIKAHAKESADTSKIENVVPVVSPAWPFAASESNEWFVKAKKVFDNRRLFTLSFEGSMMLGEKVLSVADEKYAIEPPILRDYSLLTQHLRSLNPQDPKTTFARAKKSQEQDQFILAVELLGNLVERRPNVERYWRELATSVQTAPTAAHKQILPKVYEIIRRGCEAQKPWALVTKAWLAETIEDNWKQAFEDFSKAIALDLQNPNLYFFRGLSQMSHEQPAGASQDFLKAVGLNLGGFRLSLSYAYLGNCYRELGESEIALHYYSEAIKRQPNDATFLMWEGLTLYSAGRYASAAEELEKAIKVDPSREGIKILSAHVAAALGRNEEALRILNSVRSQIELKPQLLSLAEAYLVVSPAEAVNIFETNPDLVKVNLAIASFLKAFAAILLNQTDVWKDSVSQLRSSEKTPEQEGWEITELRAFLNWGTTSGQITQVQHAELLQLIEYGGWAGKLHEKGAIT
jgi:tetratricopeptide (TPR) repeat protein